MAGVARAHLRGRARAREIRAGPPRSHSARRRSETRSKSALALNSLWEIGSAPCEDVVGDEHIRAGSTRFNGPEINTDCAEFCCGRRLWRAFIDCLAPGQFEICKTTGDDRRLYLCFQQSTGNSAFPQFNVSPGIFGNGPLYHDVANL